MTDRGTCWSLTINNPTEEDRHDIAMLPMGWTIRGQEEKGEQGTLHLQLMLKTPQVRFSAVKKQFPRAHIEKARNEQALSQYVVKSDTRVSALTVDKKFLSVPQLWVKFAEYIHDICDDAKRPLWLEWDSDDWLAVFDKAGKKLIHAGYHIELQLVNPQIRSAVKNYGEQIFLRSSQEIQMSSTPSVDSQTDKTGGVGVKTDSEEIVAVNSEEGNCTDSD